MSTLQCKSRSISKVNSQNNVGDIGRAFAESDYYKDSLNQANTVPLRVLFSYYKIKFPNNYNKISCPFPDHHEKTPSFVFYKNTNSFYCFGCSYGTRCVDLVSKIENISKQEAAKKILLMFDGQIEQAVDLCQDNEERFKILNSFSENVFLFKRRHLDLESYKFVEDLCQSYDDFCESTSLSNKALQKLTNLFNLKMKRYKNV